MKNINIYQNFNPKTPHIIIVGGTSGIGLALAKYYLSQHWQVSIIGSNEHKINTLKTQYHHNKNLFILKCDIANEKQRNELLAELNNIVFCQLIYSAGWYLNERKLKLNADENQKMLSINLQAFQLFFMWASERLKHWQSDYPNFHYHLICLSSVAGLLDFDGNSLYAKCKRTMIMTAQTYRMALADLNIGVICIASGYVNTEQLRLLNNGNASHKPFLISEQQAVNEIIYATKHNLELYIFPKPMKIITNILSTLPKPLLNKVMQWQYQRQDRFLK